MTCAVPKIVELEDSFSRPADTTNYGTSELVANSATAGLVEPLEFELNVGDGRGFEVVGARLQKSGTGVTGATFSIYLYKSFPTTAVGDNATYSTDVADFIGKITFPTMTAYTDDAQAVVHAGAVSGGFNAIAGYMGSSSIIYGLIRTEGAYTDEASAETFTATLVLKQYE